MLLLIPYSVSLLLVTGLLLLPYYYITRWLKKKLLARSTGRSLLIYFIVTVAFTALYMAAGIFLVVWVAKWMV